MNRMKELIEILNKASYSYHQFDKEIMSDKEYDDLYDELVELEKESGIIMSNSPTQKVQGFILDKLDKVKHSKPMLSADKTKDHMVIKKFIGSNLAVASWKLDGLTIVLTYKDGKFVRAVTRGGGEEGEDVTHTVKTFTNVPMKLKYCVDIEVRGEGIISWDNFDKINEGLIEPYSHPRNLASGSVRQLDPSVAKRRNLEFKAFELVQDGMNEDDFYHQGLNKDHSLEYLKDCGFDVVEHVLINVEDVNRTIVRFDPTDYPYPVDGLIFEIDDRFKAKSMGATSHHENKLMAFKWQDETYPTILRDIEWNTTRTGLCNPTAIFDTVEIDGSDVSRATLHNVSIIKKLQLGIGDEIEVYKANMIIPKVHKNNTCSNTYNIPTHCPSCGHALRLNVSDDTETLICDNDDCSSKLLSKLVNFTSKQALDIVGLSEATLETFINKGWLTRYNDVYELYEYKDEMYKLEGFGKKSVDKLLQSIEKSTETTLDRFLVGLGIPLIGRSASKTISKHYQGSFEKFISEWLQYDYFAYDFLDDFGEEKSSSLNNYLDENYHMVMYLSLEFNFKQETPTSSSNSLNGQVFVITGSLSHYANRDVLKAEIEALGGKVSGSVTSKTTYLVNNDNESNSSKNKKAKELNVPIITEEEFIQMRGEL